MIVTPYSKVKDALIKYISFMLDISERGCDASEAEKIDRKRKELHNQVVKAFGFPKDYFYREKVFTFSVEDIATAYEPYVDDSRNVEWLSTYIYDYISDRLNETDYRGIKTNRRLKYYGSKSLERLMDGYNEFLEKCESTLREWDSLKKGHNSGTTSKYESPSFWHEVNGIKSAMKNYEKMMREFLSMPADAYTKSAVEEYFKKPWDNIVEMKKKLAYETVRCQICMERFKKDIEKESKNA